MKIKAIIFDYDGVIVDSFKSVFEVYKIICAGCNGKCPNDIEEFRKLYGYNYIECRKNLGISDDLHEKAMQIFKREIVNKEHKIFDNIPKVISELNKRYRLFLVSAAYEEEVMKHLNKVDIAKYFEKISCNSGKIKKRERIKNILAANNFSTDEVISIGDRTVDYDSAKKIGLADENIIIVSYGWGYDEKKVTIKNIAHQPEDILKIIDKIIF